MYIVQELGNDIISAYSYMYDVVTYYSLYEYLPTYKMYKYNIYMDAYVESIFKLENSIDFRVISLEKYYVFSNEYCTVKVI